MKRPPELDASNSAPTPFVVAEAVDGRPQGMKVSIRIIVLVAPSAILPLGLEQARPGLHNQRVGIGDTKRRQTVHDLADHLRILPGERPLDAAPQKSELSMKQAARNSTLSIAIQGVDDMSNRIHAVVVVAAP